MPARTKWRSKSGQRACSRQCVLVASGYVGLASIIATACLLPLAVWLRADVATQAFAAVAALLVLFTHRANVQRLRAGTESRFERVRFWRRRA